MSWQLERTMTPRQFELIIKRLGLSQAAAARYLGHSERQARRYVTGEARIPEAEAMLLRSLVATGVAPIVPPWIRGGY
jgi:DNA-binding transcriptional regulator YiaG